EQPRTEVGPRHAGLGEGALVAGHADDAAHALSDQVVAAARRIRARAAEAAHRAVDQPRIHRGQRVPAATQALGHARAIVLHEHIHGPRLSLPALDTVRALDIHREAALAA